MNYWSNQTKKLKKSWSFLAYHFCFSFVKEKKKVTSLYNKTTKTQTLQNILSRLNNLSLHEPRGQFWNVIRITTRTSLASICSKYQRPGGNIRPSLHTFRRTVIVLNVLHKIKTKSTHLWFFFSPRAICSNPLLKLESLLKCQRLCSMKNTAILMSHTYFLSFLIPPELRCSRAACALGVNKTTAELFLHLVVSSCHRAPTAYLITLASKKCSAISCIINMHQLLTIMRIIGF